jgi:sugar/nucleoside kinase (ribokinase family)
MCVDLVLTGNVRPQFGQREQLIADYVVELGGSANIFASQFVKLGGRAGVVGRVGRDFFGEFALQRLKTLNVDASQVRQLASMKTGLGVALVERGDRAVLTYSGSMDAVQPEELSPDLLSLCHHWHIASYFLLTKLRSFWKEWLPICRQESVTTSLDTNWDPEDGWSGVLELLPWVDVFLPNEAEALRITGEPSVERAGERLASCGPLVVIKRGSRGAVAFRGGERWPVGAWEADNGTDQLVDTIGAGDNFDAGFLRAWLLGWDVPECLTLASRCAFASLRAAGGIEGQLREIVDGGEKRHDGW